MATSSAGQIRHKRFNGDGRNHQHTISPLPKSASFWKPPIAELPLEWFVAHGHEHLAQTLGAAENQLAIFISYSHADSDFVARSEEHTSELQSLRHLVCRL